VQTEAAIIAGCKQGDPRSQQALYRLYASRMMGVCQRYAKTRYEAEDIFHDAFVRVFRHIESFKDGSFEGAMRRIFINTAINNYHIKQTALLSAVVSGDSGTVHSPVYDRWQIRQQRQYLGGSLGSSWRVFSRGNHVLRTTIGAQWQYLVKNRLAVTRNEQDAVFAPHLAVNKFTPGVRVSVKYEHRVSDRLTMVLEPHFYYSLQPYIWRGVRNTGSALCVWHGRRRAV